MTKNRLSGLVVVIFGLLLYFWIIPTQTETVDSGWLRPETLPNITSVIIIIFGLIHFIFPKGSEEFDLAFTGRVGLFFVIGIIGLYLMSIIGFIFAAPILVLVLMLIIGERRPLWLIGGVILLPAAIWFFVDFLLNRPLP